MFTYKTNRQIEYFGNLPVEGQATDNTGGWVRQGSGIFWGRFLWRNISICTPLEAQWRAGISGISCGMTWSLEGREKDEGKEGGRTDRSTCNEGGGSEGRARAPKSKRKPASEGKRKSIKKNVWIIIAAVRRGTNTQRDKAIAKPYQPSYNYLKLWNNPK